MATNLGYNGNGRTRPATLLPDMSRDRLERGFRDGFALPNPLQYVAISRAGDNAYWHDRWDESRRHSRENSLAIARDPFVASLLQERASGVSTRSWHIEVNNEKEPRQKALKEGLTRIFKSTPYLTKHTHGLLEEGIFIGRAASQRIYEWQMIDMPAVNHQPQTAGAPAAITVREVPRRCMVVKEHEPVNGDSIGHELNGTPYVLGNASELNKLKNARIIRSTFGPALSLVGGWRAPFVLFSHKHKAADFWDWEKAE